MSRASALSRATDMPGSDKSLSIFALERTILRALCRRGVHSSARADLHAESQASAVSALQSHNWQDPEHRIVFEALARLPGRDVAELQSQLPAQATRMGFPDVSWETYFAARAPRDAQPEAARRADLETLITQLLAAAAESSS
jgi:hypothetical protein